MKDLIRQYENLAWLLIVCFVSVGFLLTINYFTDQEVRIVEEEAVFLGTGTKTSIVGKVRTVRILCRFELQRSIEEFVASEDKCGDLKIKNKVLVKLENKYSKYRWQKYYSLKHRSLISAHEI